MPWPPHIVMDQCLCRDNPFVHACRLRTFWVRAESLLSSINNLRGALRAPQMRDVRSTIDAKCCRASHPFGWLTSLRTFQRKKQTQKTTVAYSVGCNFALHCDASSHYSEHAHLYRDIATLVLMWPSVSRQKHVIHRCTWIAICCRSARVQLIIDLIKTMRRKKVDSIKPSTIYF